MTTRHEELVAARQAFVAATVVHAERPTSASPGDAALIFPDGTIEGFVGGACAESSVRIQALACLSSAQPVLLRITPDGDAVAVDDPIGRVTVSNPCLSGGTIEVFLQPWIPAPLLAVLGAGPIAAALESLGPAVGFDVRRSDTFVGLTDDVAGVVAASHGRDEEALLRAALDADVAYIGLVASPVRGAAVLSDLGVCAGHTSRVSTPAGLDIGARTPQEVALSILAEIIDARPRPERNDRATPGAVAAATATDPVCNMAVAMVAASLSLDHEGQTFWFCGSGCRDAFAASPPTYV